jgi:HlyD family secretion protein
MNPHQQNPRLFRSIALFLALGLTLPGALALSGCGKKGGDAQAKGKRGGPPVVAVQVAAVQLGTIARRIAVTGNIAALQDVSLAARVSARVTTVTVREGDHVHAGQLLVQQDTTDLESTVRQAQANVQNTQAQLAQAQTNYQIQVAQAKQNILTARAQVAAAQYNYSKVKQGSRPQQVLQGQAAVEQAKANLDNAATTLKRNQALFAQGAIARADLDTAQTTYTVNLQTYNNAKAALSLTQAGNYPQDIAYAQEQVREQQANLANQVSNEQQVLVRKQQILAAQAAVAQAQAAVRFDQQQVRYASIVSPIDGIVAARQTEPGQIATPTTTVMRIVNVRTVYYAPTISETDFAQTSVGDTVQVQADALPGRTYVGKVVAVYPAASANSRVFALRVAIDNPRQELRPGMFARGSLVTEVKRNVVVVPVGALVDAQSAGQFQVNTTSSGTATGGTTLPPQQVFVVGPGSKAVAKPVTLGLMTPNEAEVTRGLKPGDEIITTGQNLVNPGDKVNVVNAPGGRQNAPATVAAL